MVMKDCVATDYVYRNMNEPKRWLLKVYEAYVVTVLDAD
ncbi:hypothetical protein A2U01_0117826, partial [Trifolium medium]|nr:hypothetical protein [Trifolium medium]